MNDFIDYKEIISDNSLIMAIIAINMTIIGLTSLAESKSILGIDYGKFLLRKYKVFNYIRIYQLLIGFAIINVSSLFLMFVKVTEFRIANLFVLVLSLVFAIFYFFNYIIIENKGVRKQILEQELLGLYYDSNNETNFEVDLLVEMNNGSRTHNKLSGNIITYFNNFNSDTQSSFEEVFGMQSILYDYSKKTKKKRHKLFKTKPYLYRKSENGIYDISHEFFQMFRYSDLQDKWIIDILRLFNPDTANNKHDRIRLHNFARVITHINFFGSNDNIYKYKFLEYLIDYYYLSVNIDVNELQALGQQTKIEKIELFIINQLFDFIYTSVKDLKNTQTPVVSMKILNEIVLCENYKGLISKEKLLEIYLEKVCQYNDEIMKHGFIDTLNKYYTEIAITSSQIPENLKKEEIKKKIEELKNKPLPTDRVTIKELFEDQQPA